MVTKPVCSHCEAQVLASFCKESSISDKNWQISVYSIFNQNSVAFLTTSICKFAYLKNLNNFGIEYSEQHPPSRTDYMFMS